MNPKAVEYACRRLEDFARVQEGNSREAKVDAVEVLLGSLGVTSDINDQLKSWLEGFFPDYSGELFMGLILGLFINQYESL